MHLHVRYTLAPSLSPVISAPGTVRDTIGDVWNDAGQLARAMIGRQLALYFQGLLADMEKGVSENYAMTSGVTLQHKGWGCLS